MDDNNKIYLALKNYRTLLKRVDDHIQNLEKRYPDKIVCKKGCDTCCKFLTLFPVEAFSISAAFIKLPEKIQGTIAERLNNKKDACPLLIDRACALYPDRPIICRTHGYPIYIKKEGKAFIDFCPKNFKGVTSFPKDALLGIEQLNTTLAAVNYHFLESSKTKSLFLERIPISKALFMLNTGNESMQSKNSDPVTSSWDLKQQ